MTYVDLHVHLLPGVDDGPADEAASLAHAERLANEGVREATVTPHIGHPDFPLDVTTVPARMRALQSAIDAAGIDLRLHSGGEIHAQGAPSLSCDELDVIAHGPSGARWVLVEVPFTGIDATFLTACTHVRSHGFGLLIAHPERAAGLLADGLRRLRPVIDAGALLQVNVCSLLGAHGSEAEHAAARLITSGLAYVLASDGHGGSRAHTLASGPAAAVNAGASKLRTRQLTQANPHFLLRYGIPPNSTDELTAWRSRHERRVKAAIAAARQPPRPAAQYRW